MAEQFRVEGMAVLEKRLKILRERFDVRTGGVVIRGLRAGAKLIRNEARRRVTTVPKGFAALYTKGSSTVGGRKGKSKPRSLEAILRSNIVEHAIPTSARLARGQPTVLIRVRSSGYERVNGRIRFKRPGTSPGWWWWLEFGTSRTPARPFMRPAVDAQYKAAIETMRQTIAAEIEKLFQKYIPLRRAA